MKKLTRRRAIRQGGMLLGGGLLSGASGPRLLAMPQQKMPTMPPENQVRKAAVAKTIDALQLASFVDPLLLPQVLHAEGSRSSEELGAVDAPYYPVHIREVQHKMHRDLAPARMWSYGDGPTPVLFEEKRGRGVLVDWMNELPPKHLFSVAGPMHDISRLKGAPDTRVVTHLHGGRTPSVSDGYPEDWFGPGKHKLDYYPNLQDATTLWVHDHALGVSKFNVFAGLAGFYLVRDENEARLNLPSGKYELPLMIYDRSFTPDGQLYYPNPPDEGAWAQEYLGDAMVVNGKVRPYHDVQPRKYRLRIANVANSRFFALQFSNGQSFHVIGTDQGLLETPVEMTRLVLAPAERADIIVDFTRARGQNVNLTSDPFDIMQFRVGGEHMKDDSELPAKCNTIARIPAANALRDRLMTLNEFDGDNGYPMVMLLNRKHWVEPVSDFVKLNSTEIWSFVNLTEDVHPMHLHMVRFQVLDRQSFSTFDFLSYNKLVMTGPRLPPAAHEMGWKDVVQCPPDTVTRIIVPFQGHAGRYVWHCHILEHEANDMMRPYVVLA